MPKYTSRPKETVLKLVEEPSADSDRKTVKDFFTKKNLQAAKIKLQNEGENLFTKGEFVYNVLSDIKEVKNPVAASAILAMAAYAVVWPELKKGAKWVSERLLQHPALLSTQSQSQETKQIHGGLGTSQAKVPFPAYFNESNIPGIMRHKPVTDVRQCGM